jgi:hypothetical protein
VPGRLVLGRLVLELQQILLKQRLLLMLRVWQHPL